MHPETTKKKSAQFIEMFLHFYFSNFTGLIVESYAVINQENLSF